MGFWGRGHDHIGNFNFRIEIEGLTSASFKEMDGIASETEIITYGGSVDLIQRKRPGRTKWSEITLKRGYTNNPELWAWRKSVMDGKIDRRAGSVIICGDDGSEIVRYNFFEAWPTKWKGLTLDGKGTDTIVEELTLAVERVERG
ncbi:MAG: phage tail protein [Deltaproteobacteria bacterium]|nr:phage tail protein [Deltaproteobacteria bacterium]MCB9786120.1 phage tail protein [Deltaproteobacteria bacterium]